MEDNFNKHLGNKLKLRRLALGLTQTKVAKACRLPWLQRPLGSPRAAPRPGRRPHRRPRGGSLHRRQPRVALTPRPCRSVVPRGRYRPTHVRWRDRPFPHRRRLHACQITAPSRRCARHHHAGRGRTADARGHPLE
jgi:hypothetical protein